MSADKSCWKGSDRHDVSHDGSLSDEDVAALPDDQLEGYLSQNGCMEEEKLYRANPDFVVRKIAGEILAVPTGKTAHELNATMILTESGAKLWEYLSRCPQTKADLVGALEEIYDVETATAAQDVSCFLEKALTNRIVYQV